MNLHEYDIIIINSSGGKDSLVALWDMARRIKKQNYPKVKVFVSHQDLGSVEWLFTKELVKHQADLFGFQTVYSKRRNKAGYEETFLEYVVRRGKWPSNKQRWCTSDFKRGPGSRIVTALTKGIGECTVLQVFGFRKEESLARAKKNVFEFNKRLSTKKRKVFDFLPVHNWSTSLVWRLILFYKLPYHFAYDLGMPRLSCVFCIFSPFDALVIAGKENYKLLLEYIKVEEEIEHTFRDKFSLKEVKDAIDSGYEPKKVSNWVM